MRLTEGVIWFGTAGILALSGGAIRAEETEGERTTCVGVFTGRAEDVVVPTGQLCLLLGAQIEGNVLAEKFSSLGVHGGTTIEGNLLGDGAAGITVAHSRVGGSVRMTGGADFAAISATIGGSLVVEGLRGTEININTNDIGGGLALVGNSSIVSIHLSRNNIGEGAVEQGNVTPDHEVLQNAVDGTLQFDGNAGFSNISGNVVDGDLHCEGNAPPPVGAGNVAENASGQCAALR